MRRWLLAAGVVLAAGAATAPAADAFGVHLSSVDAVAPDNVWAVGSAFGDEPDPSTSALLVHWNGRSWTLDYLVDPGSNDDALTAVSASSALDVWAVGWTDTNLEGTQPAAWHFDGAAWRLWTVPLLFGAANATLVSVAAVSPKDAWAIRQTTQAYPQVSTLLRFNGRGWSQVASPLPDLIQISATSSSNVWAIGPHDAAHFDGVSWTVTPLPTQPRWSPVLHGVAALPDGGAWAVGTIAAPGYRSYTMAFRDGSWQRVPSPNPRSKQAELYAVAADAPNDAWAVGTRPWQTRYGIVPRTFTIHWDGVAWRAKPAPATGAEGSTALGVAALAPDEAWTVGWSDEVAATGLFALRWNGERWRVAFTHCC
jgi:hypothetical protein